MSFYHIYFLENSIGLEMACLVQMRTSRTPQFCQPMGCLKGWSALMQKIYWTWNMCIKPNSRQTSCLSSRHKFPSFDQGYFGKDFTGQKYIWKFIKWLGNDSNDSLCPSGFFSLFFWSNGEVAWLLALWDLATVPGWFPARQNREQKRETQQRPESKYAPFA